MTERRRRLVLAWASLSLSQGACTGRLAAGAGSDLIAGAPDDGGGRGGAGGGGDGAVGNCRPSAAPVLFSEIMYHPIVEDEPDARYEFVEIHNDSSVAVALDGWKIEGIVQYAFPAGTTIAADGYLVIAQNREKLAPVYRLGADEVLGDYTGELDNGGGDLLLRDAGGACADAVRYDDGFPWPIGADALGAGDKWFAAPDPRADFARHQHRGVSLERIRFDVPASEVGNWASSRLDGATPGAKNGAARSAKPVVEELSAARKVGDGPIRKGDDVVVRARFSTVSPPGGVSLDYFVEDVQKTGEPMTSVAMDGAAGGFSVTLPAAVNTENAIVRYRIKADHSGESVIVSPRPHGAATAGDPNAWHTYFVSSDRVIADASKGKRVYQLFVASVDWGTMWTNAGGFVTDTVHGWGRRTTGPADREYEGCKLRPEFDDDVPAVFVSDGIATDVRVRYQGSRYNRLSGEQLMSWEVPGPSTGPRPPLLLSWHIAFPKYRPFATDFAGKRTGVTLKKANYWSCPAFSNYVANKLMESVGLSSGRVKFVRTYINGAYYAYMWDLGPSDATVALPTEPPGSKAVGDFFKADGEGFMNPGDGDGPWGPADGRPLEKNAMCPAYEIWQRYQHTYERQSQDWKARAIEKDPAHPSDDAQKLVEGLAEARNKDLALGAGRVDNRKAFLEQSFDLPRLRDYIAIRNWGGPTDDIHHNYNLYKKASDGKWLIIGWDFEVEYATIPVYDGAVKTRYPQMSFYLGQEGVADNFPPGAWNRIKDAYLRSFPEELRRRLRELSGADDVPRPGQILRPSNAGTSPPNINNVIDDLTADFDIDDWNEMVIYPLSHRAGEGYPDQCRPAEFLKRMKQWAQERHAEVLRQIPP